MVNYVQSEKSNMAGTATGQQPIMLARLPHVVGAQGAPSDPAVDQSVPEPEVMPQLELRTEIQQRSRLQIAATPADGQSAGASHFVDRQHFPEHDPSERLVSPLHPKVHRHAPTQAPEKVHQHRPASSSRSSADRPMSVVAMLFQWHAVLAPYAGLIVTLALIASAGLLYWMIVGPTRAPVPNYETPSYEMQPEGFGANADYSPEYAADSKPVAELATLPKQWSPVPLSAPGPQGARPDMPTSVETKAATLPPAKTEAATLPPAKTEAATLPPAKTEAATLPPAEANAATPPQSSSIDELRFPKTSHPQKLDFTAAFPKRLPVVAQSPTESSHR